jgi:hypothetical protein
VFQYYQCFTVDSRPNFVENGVSYHNTITQIMNLVSFPFSSHNSRDGKKARIDETTFNNKSNICLPGFWRGSLRERDHWGDPDVDGRIILRGIFRKWDGLWGLDGAGSG